MFKKKSNQYQHDKCYYSKTCLNRTPMELKNLFSLHRIKLHRHLVDGIVKSVWFRQVFGLHRFKLHRHLVDGIVKSVWFRRVFGLHRFKLHRHLVDGIVKSVWFRQVFGLHRFKLQTFSRWDCKVCLV
jgi:TM2 domain-containing membrane protein YozV